MLSNIALNPNTIAILSRPASAPSPVPNLQTNLPPISAITQGTQDYQMLLPHSGGPVMAITPLTPADSKFKGKRKQREISVQPCKTGIQPRKTNIQPHKANVPISHPGPLSGVSNSPSSDNSPSSTSAISKTNLDHLGVLWPKVQHLIVEALKTTDMPPERITKLLGKCLGINVRGSISGFLCQSYRTEAEAHQC